MAKVELRSEWPRRVAPHATRPWRSVPPVAGVTHMAVTRLRTHRDVEKQATLEAFRDMLGSVAGVEDVVAFVERKLAAGRGWKFIMVEPRLYADVVEHLTKHSRRPHKAVVLFTRLFSYLPPDGNEVLADRVELARVVGITPKHVSDIMGELEAVGAVYRRR